MKKLILFVVLLSSLAYGKWVTSSMQGVISFSVGNSKANLIIECSDSLSDVYISFRANRDELPAKDIIDPRNNIRNGYLINSGNSTILNDTKRNKFLNEFVNMESFTVVTDNGDFNIKNDGSSKYKDIFLSACKYVDLPNMISYEDAQSLLDETHMLDESFIKEDFYDYNIRDVGNPYPIGYIFPTDTMVVCNKWGTVDIFHNGSIYEDKNFRDQELPCDEFKVNKEDVKNGNFKFFQED